MNNNIDWAVVAHYGISFIAMALAAMSYFGASIPGVTVDPSVAFAAGMGMFVGGHIRA